MATGGSESLGTARVDLTVDTTEYTVAIERAKSQQGELATAAEKSGQRMTAAERKRVDALERAIVKLGLTREQVLALRAAEMLHGEALEKALIKIKQNSDAITNSGNAASRATKQFNAYGLSQKQVTAAMRQVPAQMTDIFVSLAGGQNPMMVLIQQGGQLKDVFGGIRPAAAALGAQISALVNPLTAAIGATAALSAVWVVAERDARAMNTALALTNSYTVGSVSQLRDMADTMTSTNASFAKMSEVLTQVAGTGKFTASQLMLVSDAAVNMEVLTGQSIDQTVSEFDKLRRDPVKAVMELNDKYHFLTTATYDQIVALQRQGDELGAAGVAMRAYAGHVSDALDQVEGRLTSVEIKWRAVKSAALQAWSAMKTALTAETNQEALRGVNRQINEIELGAGGTLWDRIENKSISAQPGALDAKLARLKKRRSELLKEERATEEANARQRAADSRNSFLNDEAQYAPVSDKRDQAIKAISNRAANARRDAAIAYGESSKEYVLEVTKINASEKKQIEGAEDRYKDPKKAKPKGGGAARSLANATARADLQEYKDILAEEQNVIRNNQQITQAQYAAKLIDIDEYYKRSKEYLLQDTAAQEKALTGQIAVLKARSVAGKDAVDNQRQLHQLESQLARLRADTAAKMEIATIQEKRSMEERTQANKAYKKSLDDATEAMAKAWNVEIARAGMGEQEFAQAQRLTAIYDKQREALEKLHEQKRNGDITQEQWQQRVRDTMVATDAQVRVQEDGYARSLRAQQDWAAGLRGGLNSWLEGARDVSGQVRSMMTSSLDRMTDALTQFALTGKFKWREMLADILSQIVKFFAKQAVMKFAELIAGYFINGRATATASGVSGTGSGVGSSIAGGVSSVTANAKGGVYASQSLSAYSGQVVSSPTPFYFAKGGAPNVGVMGEAGHEAILPLSKGADGVLGVKMYGGGGGNVSVSVVTNVTSNGSQTSTTTTGQEAAAAKEFGAQMGRVADERIQNALRPNGTLWKAGVRV